MNAAQDKVRAYHDRLVNMLDEIDERKADLKELKDEIKGDGFNVRALVKLVQTLRKDRKQAEQEEISDMLLYAAAVGEPLEVM